MNKMKKPYKPKAITINVATDGKKTIGAAIGAPEPVKGRRGLWMKAPVSVIDTTVEPRKRDQT